MGEGSEFSPLHIPGGGEVRQIWFQALPGRSWKSVFLYQSLELPAPDSTVPPLQVSVCPSHQLPSVWAPRRGSGCGFNPVPAVQIVSGPELVTAGLFSSFCFLWWGREPTLDTCYLKAALVWSDTEPGPGHSDLWLAQGQCGWSGREETWVLSHPPLGHIGLRGIHTGGGGRGGR